MHKIEHYAKLYKGCASERGGGEKERMRERQREKVYYKVSSPNIILTCVVAIYYERDLASAQCYSVYCIVCNYQSNATVSSNIGMRYVLSLIVANNLIHNKSYHLALGIFSKVFLFKQ